MATEGSIVKCKQKKWVAAMLVLVGCFLQLLASDPGLQNQPSTLENKANIGSAPCCSYLHDPFDEELIS